MPPTFCFAGAVEKQERLQEVLLKLTRSLAHTEEQIKRVQAEAKAVNAEQAAIGRAHIKVGRAGPSA